MKKKLIIAGMAIALLAIGYFKQATSSAVIAVNVESAKTEEIKAQSWPRVH